jgi:diguanylate cyclase (GGDEF)-like protein/PAS domain S-box-containing protein
MFGLPMSQLVGRPLADLIDEPVRAGVRDWLSETGAGDVTDTREREEVAVRRDGTRFPLAMSFNAMGEIEPGMRVGILRDVSERRRTESKMQHMAHHDALTGLPNRILLMQRLEEAVASASKKQGQPNALVGLMFIDLDRFKIINDSLGHGVGDQLLIAVARRLERATRTADTVARMGGDEFVVMLPRMATTAEAEIVARKVLIALAEPVVVDGHELLVTASVGLASCPGLAQDAATLLSRADAAMYASKRAGRNSWRWFKPDLAETTSNRLQLERDLLHALDRKELEVHFQPQFDAATGSLVGAEALLRWRHPELGMIPPADFIALAEDSGLIIPIGRWVLAESLQQARSWQQGRRTPLKVAVNLSPRQMDSDALLWMVGDLLAETGVDPRLLELEITESVLVRDIESAARRLKQLADLGVSIAIDDFGVGYSSLSYLRDLPIHSIKIDRSFIRPLPDDEGAALLVSALIAMAHQLRLRVVAEGVETEAQLALLRKAGCETIQGFLLARPLTREAFAALVRRDAGIDTDADSEADARKRSGSLSRPASLFPA